MRTMKEKISRSEFVSLIISILIPGVITSFVDFDVAMFGAYAVVGSLFGIRSVGILLIVFLINHLINGIMGRIVIVSNMGPVALIRKYFGIRISLLIFFIVLFLNILSVIQIFSILRIIGNILDMNYLLVIGGLILFLAAIFLLKIPKKAMYAVVCIGLFYAVIIAHVATHIPEIARTLFSWKVLWEPFTKGNWLFYTFALLGATVTAWSQLLISRYTYRDKINLDKLEYHVMENRTISVLSFLFATAFVVAMGYLFPQQSLMTSTSADLAKLPIFIHSKIGELFVALAFFSLAATSFIAIVLSTSNAFIDFFGKATNENSVLLSKTNGIFLAILTVPALVVMQFITIDFFQTALLFGVIQSIFLIIEMRFLYVFSNNVSLMGRYKNDSIHNWALIVISVGVALTVLRIIVSLVFHV